MEDWVAYAAIVVAIGLGLVAYWRNKLYSDGKDFVQSMEATKSSWDTYQQVVTEANKNPNIQQADYDKIMLAANDLAKKTADMIQKGNVVITDLVKAKNDFINLASGIAATRGTTLDISLAGKVPQSPPPK